MSITLNEIEMDLTNVDKDTIKDMCELPIFTIRVDNEEFIMASFKTIYTMIKDGILTEKDIRENASEIYTKISDAIVKNHIKFG